MSNTTVSYIRLYHEDASMIDRIAAAYMRDALFAEFMPLPEYTQIMRCEAVQRWKVENWGTKWDAGKSTYLGANKIERRNDNEIVLVLHTAWNSPTPIFDLWVQLGFEVSACSDDQDGDGKSVVYLNGHSAEVYSRTEYGGNLFDQIVGDGFYDDLADEPVN